MGATHVIVLAGGISHERDVSLRSGRRVADALTSAGHDVTLVDPDTHLLSFLSAHPDSVIWPVVHGAVGEDGVLFELIASTGHSYVGPTPEAARLSWHKPTAGSLMSHAGLNRPRCEVLSRDSFREGDASHILDELVERLGARLVVKPAEGGSAQGVSIVTDAADLPRAMVDAFTYCDEALIEQFIDGTELGVTVIDTGNGPEALPAVEIIPLDGVYSFEARYNAGETTFFAPARLSDTSSQAAATAALSACATLGLGPLSRVDMIVDSRGTAWILEANAVPGLTETSLVPLAIEAAGRELSTTLDAVLSASL